MIFITSTIVVNASVNDEPPMANIYKEGYITFHKVQEKL